MVTSGVKRTQCARQQRRQVCTDGVEARAAAATAAADSRRRVRINKRCCSTTANTVVTAAIKFMRQIGYTKAVPLRSPVVTPLSTVGLPQHESHITPFFSSSPHQHQHHTAARTQQLGIGLQVTDPPQEDTFAPGTL